MNLSHPVPSNDEELVEYIQIHVTSVLEKNHCWKIEKIDCTTNAPEIHIYMFVNKEIPNVCPVCRKPKINVESRTPKIWMYLSLFGRKTFIHAEELCIHCPTHKKQIIIPPWDKQINEQLDLSIL